MTPQVQQTNPLTKPPEQKSTNSVFSLPYRYYSSSSFFFRMIV
jgi:hypothetical protein